jgi:hypothetical protein
MAAMNFSWYNLNGVRGYPIDDGAAWVDDDGVVPPPMVLVDCRLRWPASAGRVAYLGALAVTDGLVTLIFLAAAAADSPWGVPIAAATLPRPVVPGRHYPVSAMLPGTGGWIVLGEGIAERYAGRFSGPAQSRIIPRCARPYRALPIPSIGKEFVAGPLSGDVSVLAGPDIEVVADVRTIEGFESDALVIRLADDLNRNVLAIYAGPCGGRPESGTCPKPPLQQINTVKPDCAGNITIRFLGATATPVGGGVAVAVATGLDEACARAKYLPDADGVLPTDYVDACAGPESALPAIFEFPEEEVLAGQARAEAPPAPIAPAPAPAPAPVPYDESFAEAVPPGWRVAIGTATRLPVAPGGGPMLTLADPSRRNVLVCGRPAPPRATVSARVRLLPGPAINGGLVVAHAPEGRAYLLVLANASANSLELWRYDGVSARRVASTSLRPPARIGPHRWYTLEADVAVGGGRVEVAGRLHAESGAEMARVAGGVEGDRAGLAGLGTIDARAAFAHFSLREAP